MIIYNPANLKALSTSYNGFYNNGADVTLSGGVLSGFPESDLWTVGVDDHGDYTFSTADGKKLSMGADYTSTPLDEVNTGWKVLPAATEGCYYIQNAARATTWRWYSAKNNWSSLHPGHRRGPLCPGLLQGGAEQYAKRSRRCGRQGDQFVLYYDKDTTASGCPATAPSKGTSWRGGRYTFTNLCRSVSHHRSNRQQPDLCRCPFGYSLWTLKEVTGGFHVVSVNAKYNGNAQALEVYNSLFTTFSEKDNDYYLFNLYKLTDERPTVAGGLPEEGPRL